MPEHTHLPRGSNRLRHGPDQATNSAFLFYLEKRDRFSSLNFEANKPTVEIAQGEKAARLFSILLLKKSMALLTF